MSSKKVNVIGQKGDIPLEFCYGALITSLNWVIYFWNSENKLHDITTNKCKKRSKNPIEADFVKERVKFSFLNSCGNFFSSIWSINDTKNWCRAHSAGFKPLKTAKTRQIQKRATFGIFLARTPPFLDPKVVFLKLCQWV